MCVYVCVQVCMQVCDACMCAYMFVDMSQRTVLGKKEKGRSRREEEVGERDGKVIGYSCL